MLLVWGMLLSLPEIIPANPAHAACRCPPAAPHGTETSPGPKLSQPNAGRAAGSSLGRVGDMEQDIRGVLSVGALWEHPQGTARL